jgi:hypothetical protein
VGFGLARDPEKWNLVSDKIVLTEINWCDADLGWLHGIHST